MENLKDNYEEVFLAKNSFSLLSVHGRASSFKFFLTGYAQVTLQILCFQYLSSDFMIKYNSNRKMGDDGSEKYACPQLLRSLICGNMNSMTECALAF